MKGPRGRRVRQPNGPGKAEAVRPAASSRTRSEWISVGLFFAVLLAVGLGVAGDYGISWDEFLNREHGVEAYKYAVQGDSHLFEYDDRYYGTAVELPLYVMEVSLGLKDSRAIFIMRHQVTFLLFVAGVAFFYVLSRRLFRSWTLALLGCAVLVISPRIFGQAFYNSKDLAFLSAFVASMFTMVVWLDAKTIRHAVLHGPGLRRAHRYQGGRYRRACLHASLCCH